MQLTLKYHIWHKLDVRTLSILKEFFYKVLIIFYLIKQTSSMISQVKETDGNLDRANPAVVASNGHSLLPIESIS